MDQEFQEADVLWPDQHRDDHYGHGHHQQQRRGSRQLPHFVDAPRAAHLGPSAPVGIPEIRRYYGDGGNGAAQASSSFMPPHEIAARRRCSEERADSSVCVGHGRTLKGRDLRSVRTAVLRMTGFLES